MSSHAHHRVFVLALTAALSLSSVGLPVIVMACSMGKTVMVNGCSRQCGPAAQPSGQRISRVPCGAICGFVERNTTEYLPVKSTLHESPLRILMVVPACSFTSGSILPSSCAPTVSPPFTREHIPILVSSLLI